MFSYLSMYLLSSDRTHLKPSSFYILYLLQIAEDGDYREENNENACYEYADDN